MNYCSCNKVSSDVLPIDDSMRFAMIDQIIETMDRSNEIHRDIDRLITRLAVMSGMGVCSVCGMLICPLCGEEMTPFEWFDNMEVHEA